MKLTDFTFGKRDDRHAEKQMLEQTCALDNSRRMIGAIVAND